MDTTIDKQNIITFLKNEPLIIKDASVDRFDSDIITCESSIFAGIGLCTDQKITAGVPFDVLGIILTAEKLRRKLDMQRIILQIADTHAQSNNLLPTTEIENVARSTKLSIQRILNALELVHVKLFLSSQINKTDFKEVEKIQTQNKYLKSEVQDIEFFRKEFSTAIKLSWIIPGEQNRGHDERFFDQKHQEVFSTPMNFIHLQPGFTFEKKHWRTSPYIHLVHENRILLGRNEDVMERFSLAEKVWEDKALGGARNHLKDIVRTFESLFGNLIGMNLEQKIQFIIDMVTNDET